MSFRDPRTWRSCLSMRRLRGRARDIAFLSKSGLPALPDPSPECMAGRPCQRNFTGEIFPCDLHGSSRIGDDHPVETKRVIIAAHAKLSRGRAKARSGPEVSRWAGGNTRSPSHMGFDTGISSPCPLFDSWRGDNGKRDGMAGIPAEVSGSGPAFIKTVPWDLFVGSEGIDAGV